MLLLRLTRLFSCPSLLRRAGLQACRLRGHTTRGFASRSFESDLKEFPRDTILYETNTLSQLRMYQLYALFHFMLFGYCGAFFFNYLGSIYPEEQPVENPDSDKKEESFWQKLSRVERNYHIHLAVFCGLVGYGGVMIIGFFSTRAVQRMIVRKGGTHATILTSRAVSISKLRELTVPLSHISCKTSRENASSYMTFKVKGHPFFFLVDKQGTFYNAYLFDRTFGLQRNLNKA